MNYADLLIWQYQGKPKALAHAQLIIDTFQGAIDELAQVPEIMNIDTATGAALDLCGKRVGQSRVLQNFYPRDVFGFEQTEGAKGFARLGLGGGGKWYRYGDPTRDTVVLTDDDYRFLIKCRITKNFQTGNIQAITDVLRFIFTDGIAYDNYDTSVSVVIRSSVSDFKKYIIKNLDILPRPSGVGIKHYISTSKKAFGFKDEPHAVGFNKGGRWARIL